MFGFKLRNSVWIASIDSVQSIAIYLQLFAYVAINKGLVQG